MSTVPSTGKSYLRADPNVECTLAGGPWVGVFLVACLFALPNVLGFPLRARQVLRRGRSSGDFLSESFVRRYGGLFVVFDEDHWWWTIIMVNMRRVLLTVTVTFLSNIPDAKLLPCILSMAIHLWYGACTLWARPFRDFSKAYEADQRRDLNNLDKQTVILTVLQCITLGLGMWSSSVGADAANGTDATADTGDTAAQHDAISALFILVLVMSQATTLLFMFRVRRNSKKAEAEGMKVFLPEGWKWCVSSFSVVLFLLFPNQLNI